MVDRAGLESIMEAFPPSILRVKGFLRLTFQPEKPSLLQRVEKRWRLFPVENKPVKSEVGRLVLIGTPDMPDVEAAGAEIHEVDLSGEISSETFSAIHQVWLESGVILFRDQKLTPDQQLQFSRRFGELEMPPSSEISNRKEAGADSTPEIWIIFNIIENGKQVGCA